jgi:hypothetical protein
MIEIQKNYADGSFLAMSQGNRVRDAVPKQRAIRQVGHRIVLRGVNHQFRHGPRGGDVVKDNHGTDDHAVTVVNGRGRIFYCGFIAVTPHEDAVASEAHRLVAADGQRHGGPAQVLAWRHQECERSRQAVFLWLPCASSRSWFQRRY